MTMRKFTTAVLMIALMVMAVMKVRAPHLTKYTCYSQCSGEGYEPVCGNDGMTYYNKCYLECMGATEVDSEECT